MERRGDKVDIVQRVSCWISDMAFARFKSFSDRVLGIQIDEIPTVESILMRQNFSVVFYAAILFILTNGIYLVKNIAARSMIPIDMVPLYMMIGGSLAMLVFTIAYKKRGGEYDAPPARFALLAYNDVMTETLNKKAMETYGTFIADKTAPERVSVIIFDVDDFKSYNDNYSHMKGDEALRRVAGSVVGVLAAADRYLFRFGGEEFVAILPDIGEEEARRIAGALLDAVRAAAVPREDLPDRHIVTASFGVACGTGRELKDFSLIAKADRQLYICKNNGKNCVAASGAIYK